MGKPWGFRIISPMCQPCTKGSFFYSNIPKPWDLFSWNLRLEMKFDWFTRLIDILLETISKQTTNNYLVGLKTMVCNNRHGGSGEKIFQNSWALSSLRFLSSQCRKVWHFTESSSPEVAFCQVWLNSPLFHVLYLIRISYWRGIFEKKIEFLSPEYILCHFWLKFEKQEVHGPQCPPEKHFQAINKPEHIYDHTSRFA